MPLYSKKNGKLTMLNALSTQKEKDLQNLVEDNMTELLDMNFIATEYRTTSGGRIDTLAVDSLGAPVIVEYKRNKNDNIINQSLSYLKWLKAQKQEFFEMMMLNKLGKEVADGIGLDWKHPRVVCIAEAYSPFDIDTVEVVPLRIDLFKYRHYEDELFSLEKVNIDNKHGNTYVLDQCIDSEAKASVIEAMKTQDSVLPAISHMFDELRERILEMDEDILEKPGKRVIAYRISKIFAEIMIRRDKLVINLRPIDYEDPRSLVEAIAQGYTVTLNRRITISSAGDLDYAMGIITQSYQNVL